MFNEQKFELVRCPIGEGLKIDSGVNSTPQEQMQREVDYVERSKYSLLCLRKV